MYYVIQENTFREANYNMVINAIERAGLEYEIVKVYPFIDDVEVKTDRKDVFVFGSLKLARVAKNFGWHPGSLMNSNNDYRVYSKYYKDNLLNWDSKVCDFTDEFDIPKPKFIRPCEDTKSFNGGLYDHEEWSQIIERSLKNNFNTNFQIQVAEPKKVFKEWRFWVVDGKIITQSQYRLGGRFCTDSFVEPGAIEFAQSMVDKFQLAESFVIDICSTDYGFEDRGYKIVD